VTPRKFRYWINNCPESDDSEFYLVPSRGVPHAGKKLKPWLYRDCASSMRAGRKAFRVPHRRFSEATTTRFGGRGRQRDQRLPVHAGAKFVRVCDPGNS